MRIKKDNLTKNEYIPADNVWVRNFTKECVEPTTLSPLIMPSEYSLIINNESRNTALQISNISDEPLYFQNILIISDGYGFKKQHKLLSGLPPEIAVIAVNRALVKWELASGKDRKPINLYIVNNPYKECLGYLPEKYFPTCVASSRTNHEFVRRYKGRKYLYESTPARTFGVARRAAYHIDDYRNPICAAIGMSYRLRARKVLLMCCDDSFENHREGSIQLENGLFTYPQHIKNQRIIDANLYWLTHQEDFEVKVGDFSSGINYVNSAYVGSEQEMLDFFEVQSQVPNVLPP
jgi:hypothetical protein